MTPFSGSIHAHCMLWLEGSPEFIPDDFSTYTACEIFIDQYITCKKDMTLGELMNKQFHKHSRTCKKNVKSSQVCRFDFPRPPMRTTKILLPLSAEDGKKEYKQLMNVIEVKTERIARTHENCSFDEYLQMLQVNENDYIKAVRSKLKRATVCLRRNVCERKVNAYNKDMLTLWESNMDMQFVSCLSLFIIFVLIFNR